MAEPFLSEIRIFSFVFAPKGWALCNGQLLPINQNTTLFALLGTTHGLSLRDVGETGRRHRRDRPTSSATATAHTHSPRHVKPSASPSATRL